MKKLLVKIIKNPSVLYVFSRYATYFIQFINSLFIAVYLGPYYLGVWGFITLLISYASVINLGVPNAINIVLSLKKDNDTLVQKIVSNSIVLLIILSFFLIAVFLVFDNFYSRIGEKYSFLNYQIPVFIIIIFNHINTLLVNVSRVYGKIFLMALNQSLFPLLLLIVIPFFEKNSLLWAMLFLNLFSVIVSFLLLIIKSPVKINFVLDVKILTSILSKGWYLFIYNCSFYLIIISTRTYISSNYSINEFGYFTFAFSLANAVFLLLNAIYHLIFPKLINRIGNYGNQKTLSLIAEFRLVYISLSHFLAHLIILIFPLFLLLFPRYEDAFTVFGTIVLTLSLGLFGAGYTEVLFARMKEKRMAVITLISLVVNVVFLIVNYYYFKLAFDYVIIASMISYFVFTFLIAIYATKELKLNFSIIEVFKDIFPLRLILPLILSFVFFLLNCNEWMFVFPFLTFIVFNVKAFVPIKNIAKKIVTNPNVVNI